MKNFYFKIIILSLSTCIVISLYCYCATIISSAYNGPTTEELITSSFKNALNSNYDCYFLGNSRVYRGVNPDRFVSVSAYNFAHDNDSYNQMYYKLLYLLDSGKTIDYLIIGTDYFQFSFISSSRNYVYNQLFPNEYSKDYGQNTWFDIKKDYILSMWANKQNCLRPCFKYIVGEKQPELISYQKKNGQYIMQGTATPQSVVLRDYTILDIQLSYFKKIIKLCQNNNIELFVIMPPLCYGETKLHTDEERLDFNNMIYQSLRGTKYANNYLNYSEEYGLSPYSDFIDVTHLNQEAADRYSMYLNGKIFDELDEKTDINHS